MSHRPPEPTPQHHTTPWPTGAWPDAVQVLEYARVSPSAEALRYLEALLAQARAGAECGQYRHADWILREQATTADVRRQLDRVRLAAANARRRAGHWRDIAMGRRDIASATPDMTAGFLEQTVVPAVVSIVDPAGKTLLAIHDDGTVEGDLEDAGDAAAVFVVELRRLMGTPA